MAYNTREILRDVRKNPIPQAFDPVLNNFIPLTGRELGNDRYGSDNIMWGQSESGIYVPVKVTDNGEVVTQLTGSMVEIPGAAKVEVVTVIDAASVAAGDSILVPDGVIPRNNYHELWFALAIDRQPWRMRFRSFFSTALSTTVFFPEADNKTTTHTTANPFMALYHRFPFPGGDIQKPNNLVEAKQIIMPYELGEPFIGRVYNDSNELATVTLKAIMIWR